MIGLTSKVQRLIVTSVIASSLLGCTAAGAPDPSPQVIYVTPPPTPVVIYVTPAPTIAAAIADPTATPAPAVAPTPKPTRKPRPTSPPVSADTKAYERLIKAHIPASFRSICTPNRNDLPPLAVAGIECRIRGAAVKLVGYYLFESRSAMDAAYYNRLTEYGVEPGSVGCSYGVPGDGTWYYTNTYETEGRLGCFFNEGGNANLRWTNDKLLIYAGIVGRGRDIAGALEWWRVEAGPFEYSP